VTLTGFLAVPTASAVITRGQQAAREAKGKQHIEAGQYEAAVVEFGRWKGELGLAFTDHARSMVRAGNTEAALEAYRAYFQYFIYELSNAGPEEDWLQAGREYADLLWACHVAGRPLSAKDNYELAATCLYYATPSGQADTVAASEKRLTSLIENYPRSLFVPLAVRLLESAIFYHDRKPATSSEQWCERLAAIMAQLREAGAQRNEFQVGRIWLERQASGTEAEEMVQQKLIDDLINLAQYDHERRALTLLRAKTACESREYYLTPKGVDIGTQRVRLYREVIEKYPGTDEAVEAEIGVLTMMLKAERFHLAMRTFRAAEKAAAPDTDFSRQLMLLASHFERWIGGKMDMQWSQARAIYEEIIRRDYTAAPEAHLRLASGLDLLGENSLATIHYKAAYHAARSRENTADEDAHNHSTMSQAARALALKAERQGDWSAGLRWWQVYRPSSGCGTCNDGLNSTKTYHIAQNLRKLGRIGEAQKLLETTVTKPAFTVSETNIKLTVDLFQQRGQLAQLKQIAEKALADPETGKYNKAAKLALVEIALRTAPKGQAKQRRA